jgi:glyoxylase-like metal-dependent hydrolase (beta-lactamase superfamily II)
MMNEKEAFDWPEQVMPANEDQKPYLKKLQNQYGMKVYPIDPYVAVFKIRGNVWAMYAPCTHAMGDNWLYLVEGPEKALFIDNGWGFGDLKGLGEMLTGKPVLSAVTHFHMDHCGGNPQWDEIYCHRFTADILESVMDHYEQWWKQFNHVGEEQHRHYYKDEDLVQYKGYKALHLANHHIINLGEDYDIELIHVGGHAPGESCFLDKKGRILYSGDAMFAKHEHLAAGLFTGGPFKVLHSEYLGVSYYSRQIKLLADRVNEFDSVMPGHGQIDCSSQIATGVSNAAQAVIADPYCYDRVVDNHGRKLYIKDGGTAYIAYDPEDAKENLCKYPVDSWGET